MTCTEARALMLDRADERRRGGARRSLARHLAACAACRGEFGGLQLAAELLAAWPDVPVGEHQKAACVMALCASFGGPSERARRAWLLPAGPRLAAVAATVALVLFIGPLTGGLAGIVAEVGQALESIDEWRAEGTATPPLLVGPEPRVCNHVVIWFRRPDAMHLRVDDGPQGPLYTLTRSGGRWRSYDPYDLVDEGLEHEAAQVKVREVFSVGDWLASKRLMEAPVRDFGLEQFGRLSVRRIEITPTRGWFERDAPADLPRVTLRVDAETMLPVLLETTARGSVVVLDFDYGAPFPEEALEGLH